MRSPKCKRATWLQRIRHCLQVSLRQMEITGSGLQVHMAEQDLDRTQVCSRLEQVSGPAVTTMSHER